jgi:hypothetical protein
MKKQVLGFLGFHGCEYSDCSNLDAKNTARRLIQSVINDLYIIWCNNLEDRDPEILIRNKSMMVRKTKDFEFKISA